LPDEIDATTPVVSLKVKLPNLDAKLLPGFCDLVDLAYLKPKLNEKVSI
jgi:hypothetical protein